MNQMSKNTIELVLNTLASDDLMHMLLYVQLTKAPQIYPVLIDLMHDPIEIASELLFFDSHVRDCRSAVYVYEQSWQVILPCYLNKLSYGSYIYFYGMFPK